VIDEAVVLLDVPWTPDPEVWRELARRREAVGERPELLPVAVHRDRYLTAACRVEVELRDTRELRGEAIDWTRPVEGWVLW
jgi:hypothetical protein